MAFIRSNTFLKGFTLIELLIVIAILGVLATGVLVAIDPIDKINATNDAKVQQDIQALALAMESYAIHSNGAYSSASDNSGQRQMKAVGDLKRIIQPPSGYNTFWLDIICGEPECRKPEYGIWPSGEIRIVSELKSKKYLNASPSTPWWVWCASSGKSGPTINRDTCP